MMPPKLREILETLDLVEDRQERMMFLLSFSESFQPVPSEIATKPFPEEARVPGCESEAFIFSKRRPNGLLDFYFAVQNPQGVSAMALAKILQDAFSGTPKEEILAVPDDVIYRIFGNELSMGKSMGLMGMVAMCKREARKGIIGCS